MLGRAKHELRYCALYFTAAGTGLRSSELAGLEWAGPSLKLGVIRVRHAFLRVGVDVPTALHV